MKRFTTLLAGLFAVFFLGTSCSKEDANLSNGQNGGFDMEQGSAEGLLANMSSVYRYGAISLNGEGTYIGSSDLFGEVGYRIYSTETELANNIVKMAVYFSDKDSTFYVYSNPDYTVNKVSFKSMKGNRLTNFRPNDFQTLYQFEEKTMTDLELTPIDPARSRALALTLAYTFGPEMVGRSIDAPKTPTTPTFKVRIRRNTVDPDYSNMCADPDCVVRDGWIRNNHIFLVWWHCAC